MATTKTAAASKAAAKQTAPKTASKKAPPNAKADAKVKKTTTGIKKSPSPYNIFFKANYQRVKEEHPELLSKEMMAKMAEIWKLDSANPKSSNYNGPPPPKKVKT
ncbi:hypothetical protein MMC16_004981 [Acarospora aff. strigata]|nr:hypothetical protein [Acarospora aff. strigata]